MIKISRLIIKNFRGIRNADIAFSDTNFLVGNNGTGKTSCLAAIARLMPILRGEKRIFLDGDFLFDTNDNAEPIELTYFFDLITDNHSESEMDVELHVKGTRSENGKIRSHLNDQKPGDLAALFSNNAIVVNHIESLTGKDMLTQRVIRNGWTSTPS